MKRRWMIVEGWRRAHLFTPQAGTRGAFLWMECERDGVIGKDHLSPDDGRPRCKRCLAVAKRLAREEEA
jgi:hypothetical protein